MLEILAPAGNCESAMAAIHNGANAIYLGLSSSFSARQGADNFDEQTFRLILLQAHLRGVKVYVALNTVVKGASQEFETFLRDLLFAWNEGADAIILQDALLGKYIHKIYPDIILHLSTQAGTCNLEGAKFAKECGFSRVILARETPLEDIKKIAAFMETETFVQGALCTCFSGQCYFSSFAGGNSGNRGRCKQPCRKLYSYDRNENSEKNYALSLSDLCVGEDIQKLINVGVISFKIEGRMRRPEYVAAATKYYRAILDEDSRLDSSLSDLKRTYNRGNYTKGLAFGQDKRFLSTSIQGHLGEKVGVVKVINKDYFVESRFQPRKGDGFKILRAGKEVGGGIYIKTQGKGFVIDSKTRLKNGDGVFITTDNAVNERVLSSKIPSNLTFSLIFSQGNPAQAIWNGHTIHSDFVLQSAQNRPLSYEEILSCFDKTDGMVDTVSAEIKKLDEVFIPKSELNAFRRKVYEFIFDKLRKGEDRAQLFAQISIDENLPASNGVNHKTAIISDDFTGLRADIAIYKPKNYSVALPESFLKGSFEKFIYYPAFTTSTDLERIEELVKEYSLDGVYADGYSGLIFAKEKRIKIFAGTGFNLTNEYALSELLLYPQLAYYSVSKELTEEEAKCLKSEKTFALSMGDIKIMDLCYCPFEKTCSQCDKREIYTLTDENGRNFPTRRYVTANGSCRFEVYNCASLVGRGLSNIGQLLDLSVETAKLSAVHNKDNEEKQKEIFKNYTSGHYKRGVL